MNPFTPAGAQRAVRRGERILDLLLAARRAHGRRARAGAGADPDACASRPRASGRAAALHFVLRFEEWLKDPETRRGRRASPCSRRPSTSTCSSEVQDLALQTVRAWRGPGRGQRRRGRVDRETERGRWPGSARPTTSTPRTRAPSTTRACRARRAARSKPFLFALALERGAITPATILDDLERGPGRHHERRRPLPRSAPAARRARQLAQRAGGRAARPDRPRRGLRVPPRPRAARRPRARAPLRPGSRHRRAARDPRAARARLHRARRRRAAARACAGREGRACAKRGASSPRTRRAR